LGSDHLEVNFYDEKKIEHIINKAIENNSEYIQLYTHYQFEEYQKTKKRIDDNLYHMVEQWGAVVYLISKKGAKYILDNIPIDENIDMKFNNSIIELNSLCYFNDIFLNKGDLDLSNKGQLGSVIYNTITN